MAMVINSNIMSLNAQRNLTLSQGEQNQAMERLTSGKRINSAADDAAGLAISNRMTSQVRGLDQAIRNANDGVSLIQTAEGALDESTNILQRMRELSIQSANGTYDEGNRSTLNAEVQQLVSELDRIAETTAFNGLNILDGTLGEVDLQVGSEANQTITLEIQAMDASTLGLGSTSVDVLGSPTQALTGFSLNDGDVLINGQSIGDFNGTNAAVAGIGEQNETMDDLVKSINENVNGVTASTRAEVNLGKTGTGVLEGADSIQITVTDDAGNAQTYNVGDTSSLEELADKIGTVTGNQVSASINDDGELVLNAEDVTSLAVVDNSTGDAAVGGDKSANASIALTSDNGDDITITRGTTGNLSDLNNLGFIETSEAGSLKGTSLDGTAETDAFSEGGVTINGVAIDNDGTTDLAGKLDAINDVSGETGVTASAYSTVQLTDYTSAASTALTINGVSIAATTTANTLQDVATLINNASTDTGVTAYVSGQDLILEGDGSMTLGNFDDLSFEASKTNSSTDGFTAAAGAALTDDETIQAGIQLSSTNGNPIQLDVATTADAVALGLTDQNVSEDGRFGTAINSIDISTAAGAQKAIDVIDNALETINETRGDLGAINNRLDFTVNNLANVSENVAAARSRIEDADFAAESAALSRAQVLQQAGTAMLAQANAAPQQVLSLLQ
ncbi:flagellin [Neptuniibacter sp. QD72_48]|uniref:flagellin N-terminal helical domain-containing protein n=1 Tax=unclassified Neptuniibacter TaxID=2630693 RepID=UPI0039F462A6